jgi:hypothetical protein
MIYDDPSPSAPQLPQPGIFTRIMTAAAKAKAMRLDASYPSVFLGDKEWDELQKLCQTFDVNWKGGGVEGYDPRQNEDQRAEFSGCKIYRVDAVSYLAAL